MNRKVVRENYLMNLLQSTGRITTGEAVELLDISEATARRMFSELEKKGKIVRNYGGIQLANASREYSFEANEKTFTAEKKLIGKLAASLVTSRDTIYLDCGTTVFHMALELGERIANRELTSINIITNSIANVQAIKETEDCKVVLVGGVYNQRRRDFSGTLTEKWIQPFHFTKCFLGSDGVTEQMGFSSNQFDISSLNACVIGRSAQVHVLLDNSKFNRCSLVSYASLGEIQTIVTNVSPDADLRSCLESANIQILLPEETTQP